MDNAIKYLVNTKGIAKGRILFTLDCPAEDFLFVSVGDYDTIKQMPVPGSIKQRWRSFGIDEFHGELAQELVRRQAKKHQMVGLQNTDGDGITDQFDLKPNTPPNAEVDTHGRAVDTDGDSVPDYKDKEKLTPQSCFPVNSDGMGTCPEPPCCRMRGEDPIPALIPAAGCYIDSLPYIKFSAGTATLSKKAKFTLDSVAQIMLANPRCHVKVVSYGNYTYKGNQLSWDRVYTIVKYLIDAKGILNTHILFAYAQNGGDTNTVDLMPTREDGPNIVPAPHPVYSTLKYHKVDW